MSSGEPDPREERFRLLDAIYPGTDHRADWTSRQNELLKASGVEALQTIERLIREGWMVDFLPMVTAGGTDKSCCIASPADVSTASQYSSVTGHLKTGRVGSNQNRPVVLVLLYLMVPILFKPFPL